MSSGSIGLCETPVEPADHGLQDREEGQAAPVQSIEDTDIAWGEAFGPDEDDRLYRDRPPRWGSE